jgi:hypothetical protein
VAFHKWEKLKTNIIKGENILCKYCDRLFRKSIKEEHCEIGALVEYLGDIGERMLPLIQRVKELEGRIKDLEMELKENISDIEDKIRERM